MSIFITNGTNEFYRQEVKFNELVSDLLSFFYDSSDSFWHKIKDSNDLEELTNVLKRFGYKVTIGGDLIL